MAAVGPKEEKVGGIVFFLSLIFLMLLSALYWRASLEKLTLAAFSQLRWVALGIVIGGAAAALLVHGRLSVFFHELKHSALSNVAGNKAKKMEVSPTSGYFEYSYTKATAPYHAFIALAPYWFPLFTAPTLLLVTLAPLLTDIGSRIAVGIAWGADLLLGLRDIHPAQTDFTNIRGGYMIGITYICAVISLLAAIIVSWGAFGWIHGVQAHATRMIDLLIQVLHGAPLK